MRGADSEVHEMGALQPGAGHFRRLALPHLVSRAGGGDLRAISGITLEEQASSRDEVSARGHERLDASQRLVEMHEEEVMAPEGAFAGLCRAGGKPIVLEVESVEFEVIAKGETATGNDSERCSLEA